jgi:hypothetical protein
MRHRVRTQPPPRRPEPGPPLEHPLAGLPNHALARVLARAPKPDPQRTKVKEIADINKTIGADEWERTVNAGGSVIPLYSDLATQLGAAGIAGIPGTGVNDIKGALTPTAGQLAPGLNLVSRGLGKGRCWYLEDGVPENKLIVRAKGPLPKIAIGVAKTIFIPGNKAFALATLRHEIEHAQHRQMALDWMQKWRDAGAKGDFRVWLGTQPIATADRALIGELTEGETVNTEVLAHLEGFITAFPQEDHSTANPERSVYEQLRAIGEKWGPASVDVKTEAVKRIKEMKGRQKGPALAALKAAFTRLKGEKDAPKELVDAVLSAP